MTNKDLIKQSIDSIEHDIESNLNADILSSNVYISKYYYQRMFREIVGDSVMQYVKKRKLSLAGRELLDTNTTVLDIAIKYGYSSHESFTRAFKSYMGITPADYRKYGLSDISKKPYHKESVIMNNYSKTTDDIIKELNEFVAEAKHTTEFAEKNCVYEYLSFWQAVTKRTDIFINKLQITLHDIAHVADNPDEIVNRFSIIKMIEDVAFFSNVTAFAVNLYIARGLPDHIEEQAHICERFDTLAKNSAIKTSLVTKLFNELSQMIFEDMKKSAKAKANEVVALGCRVVTNTKIKEYSYICDEIKAIVDELSITPVEKLSENVFEEFAFRMEIVMIAAELDTTRTVNDYEIIDSLSEFLGSIKHTQEYFSELIKPESAPIIFRSKAKYFDDIAFQINVMYLFVKGEVSNQKLGSILTSQQKEKFSIILDKINSTIEYIIDSATKCERTDFNSSVTFTKISDMILEVSCLLEEQAAALSEKGGAVMFLANQFKLLSHGVKRSC